MCSKGAQKFAKANEEKSTALDYLIQHVTSYYSVKYGKCFIEFSTYHNSDTRIGSEVTVSDAFEHTQYADFMDSEWKTDKEMAVIDCKVRLLGSDYVQCRDWDKWKKLVRACAPLVSTAVVAAAKFQWGTAACNSKCVLRMQLLAFYRWRMEL